MFYSSLRRDFLKNIKDEKYFIEKNAKQIYFAALSMQDADKGKESGKNPQPLKATSDADKDSKVSTNKPKESQSFVMNLFTGTMNTSQIFPFPEALTDEQREMLGAVYDPFNKFLTEKNDPVKNEELGNVEPATIEGLWELGVFGLQAPPDLGGLGLTNTQYAALVESVGINLDLALGIVLGAHQSIGFKGIVMFGTPEQQSKYLPRLTTGKEMAAFCLTEPSAGSDAGSIKTKAILSPDGKHYIMNGSKLWISNGSFAEVFTVFAKTPVKDPETGKEQDKVTAFIVERSFGGITNGAPEVKMGIKASNTAAVFFEDCKVPVENVLGKVGEGFKVAMHILNGGRFGMAAVMSGCMRALTKKATEFATNRMQFGRRIDSFQGVQEKLAQMALLHYVTESMAYMLSGIMDQGSKDFHLEAAISKVFASESAWTVADHTIQIMGGMGYMKANGVEKVMRDLRIFRIFEGTNDVLRLFVPLSGIKHAGSSLKELQNAFKQPAAHLSLIVTELAKRGLRSVGLGGVPQIQHLVDPELKLEAMLLAKTVPQFAEVVEKLLLKYGKGIVEEQFLLNRLANAAIDIYAMAVVLSRSSLTVKLNLPSAQHELLLAKAWCAEASHRVSQNLTATSSQAHKEYFNKMSEIAKNISESGGFPHKNPIGY